MGPAWHEPADASGHACAHSTMLGSEASRAYACEPCLHLASCYSCTCNAMRPVNAQPGVFVCPLDSQVRLVWPAGGWQAVWTHQLLPGERALSVAAVRLTDQATGATVPLPGLVGGLASAAVLHRSSSVPHSAMTALRRRGVLCLQRTAQCVLPNCWRRRGLPLWRPPAAV